MTDSLATFAAGLLAAWTLWYARAIFAARSGNADPPRNHQIPQVDLGWGDYGGEPMDWLAAFGAGALFVGVGIAIIVDLVILVINPKGPYVSDALRSVFGQYPVLIFAAGVVAGHLFWNTVSAPK